MDDVKMYYSRFSAFGPSMITILKRKIIYLRKVVRQVQAKFIRPAVNYRSKRLTLPLLLKSEGVNTPLPDADE
jgi:hypothetical protein